MKLSVTLADVKEALELNLYHCTTGKYKREYDISAILELQDIINRVTTLMEKLEDDGFEGDYRYQLIN